MDINGFALVIGGGKHTYHALEFPYLPGYSPPGSGIGRGCAVALAKDGAVGIVVADVNLQAADDTSKACLAVVTNQSFLSRSMHVDVTSF
jgi:NAD(P)-dependent dehydrogenase (short-subunit alcohol dehydrogenase family)